MLNGLSPLDSMFQFQPRTPDPLLGQNLTTNFNTVYNNLLAQKNSTTAKSALQQFRQVENSNTFALEDMFANPETSFLGFGISNLFGVGGALGLPAWAHDVERLAGPGDSNMKKLFALNQQAALLAQPSLNTFGMPDGGDIFSSLI